MALTDPVKSMKKSVNSTSKQIYFDIDDESPDAPTQVKQLIDELKVRFGDQPLNIKVTGRTCDLGPEAYNHQLAEQRAYAVMEMMMMQGLNINFIEVESLGEKNPLVPNNSEANRKENRSVSVYVFAGGLSDYLASL